MDLEHIKYMLNSEPMNEDIMLDHECLKPTAMISIDREILLEVMLARGDNYMRYRATLNL